MLQLYKLYCLYNTESQRERVRERGDYLMWKWLVWDKCKLSQLQWDVFGPIMKTIINCMFLHKIHEYDTLFQSEKMLGGNTSREMLLIMY